MLPWQLLEQSQRLSSTKWEINERWQSIKEGRLDETCKVGFSTASLCANVDLTMGYDDEYPTCAKTDALLRIFSDEISPSEISSILGVSPTSTQFKGELKNPNVPKSISKVHCWYFGSRDSVQSKDCRRHLDWVIDNIYPKKEGILKLKEMGADINICCIWESSSNEGGPTMDPKQMAPLSEMGIPVWWEFWYSY